MSGLLETDDADLLVRIRRFQTLGSVLSLEKLGQIFFAVIMTWFLVMVMVMVFNV
jgi:hypothetical protein